MLKLGNPKSGKVDRITMTSIDEQIMKLEKGFWDRANEPEFYEEAMTDDAIAVIEPMGFVDKKSAAKMAETSGHAWKEVKMEDLHTIRLAEDCAALAYHCEAKDSEGKPYRVAISSVYVKRGGAWKLALTNHQPWKPDSKA